MTTLPQPFNTARILKLLYILRSITFSLILISALLAVLIFDFVLPTTQLVVVLLVIATINLSTWMFIRYNRLMNNRGIMLQLIIEIFTYTLVFYLTDGAANPFTVFYLLPLAVAATVLPARMSWMLCVFSIVCYSLLFKFYIPLGLPMQQHLYDDQNFNFSHHVFGMWFGFIVSAVLLTWFVSYLADALRKRDHLISEAKAREIRDQQVVTLGALAAGTAHELGTPLASMALVASDLTDGFDRHQHPELFENREILRQQLQRCKNILSVLSNNANISQAHQGYRVTANEFISMIDSHWHNLRPEAELTVNNHIAASCTETLMYDLTILQVVINLLNNADDVAQTPVRLTAECNNNQLIIQIDDDGPGIPQAQIEKLAEVSFSHKPHGLGIGLFLSVTTLQRIQGSLSFKQNKPRGTSTLVSLPLIKS